MHSRTTARRIANMSIRIRVIDGWFAAGWP
jgi:hypothetical protein